ncbi:hypothetical protein BU16DRAFT_123522 [Lophium mytilinum]|uniref:Uncharacterized protein n=1 Tax=Lophium mytilinum TaxID=390894 RepID=A0A6A6QGT4_9PEZI|nr:hypothetical protein BU16DRAFT_123522 [Lophium mytilinum]
MARTEEDQEFLLMEVLDRPMQETSKNTPSSQSAKNGELHSNLSRVSGDLEHSTSQICGLPWEPGFFRQLPWSAFGALFLALASILACIIIVVSSHGKLVDTWPVKPSIWLALLAAATNACLRYAFVEGASIFWWNQAVQGGTIQGLHQTWMSGTRLKAAVTAGRRFDWLALASIVVAVVAIDGPLLQRASSTTLKVLDPRPAIVNVTVATEVPLGYSGFELQSGTGGMKSERPFLSSRFQQVMQAYSARSPISATDFSGCRGTCSGAIKAAGLYSECSHFEDDFTWIKTQTSSSTGGVVKPGSLFSVNFSWSEAGNIMKVFDRTHNRDILPVPKDTVGSDEPFINLEVVYSTKSITIFPNSSVCEPSCPYNLSLSGSHRVHQSCKLYAATKSYPVIIQPSVSTANSSLEITDPTSAVNYFVTPNGSPVMINGSLQNTRKVIADSLHSENLTGIRLMNPVPYLSKDLDSYAGKYSWPVFETLSGIASSAQNLLGTNVSFLGLNGSQVAIQFDGSLAMQYLRSDSPGLSGDDGWVGLTFNDPMASLFSALDEIMLRVAVDAANINTLELVQENLESSRKGLNFTSFPKTQSVTMMETRTVQVYHSDYRYLAAALVVVFLTTFAIVPTFQGFWGLGRKTSLSPFETAKALGAPLLDDGVSNACAEELVKRVYPLPIQYGEVVDPVNGGNDGKGGVQRRMLRIAPSGDVVKPSRDTLYF